jgi:hypothetical protein
MAWWSPKDAARAVLSRLNKSGFVSGRLAQVLRLPFNPTLRAYNVHEVPVERSLIEDARTLYEHHIAPRLGQHGACRSGDLALHVTRPAASWESDIGYWSADDPATFQYFEAKLFQRMNLEPFRRWLDLEREIRLYCTFIIVRSRCHRLTFHKDYVWSCGRQCYTLMAPLQDCAASDEGHLAYLDSWGRPRVYRYRLGTAVAFGAGFTHSTQIMTGGPPRAFLCFTFGSDKDRYWPELQRSVYGESRLLRRPGGELIRDALFAKRAGEI